MKRYRISLIIITIALVFQTGTFPAKPKPIPNEDQLVSVLANALSPYRQWQIQGEKPATVYVPQHSNLVIGTINGRLSYNEQEKILTDIFQTLAVSDPWQMRDGNLVTWGGYSPQLAGFLRDAQGETINIQGALRYHQVENRTYLHLGSPLIYAEY